MDEARIQAYITLIEQLLACSNDEELNNILQANQELIDPEFLQVMENYATWLEEQGNNNPAAWLRNMAQRLGQYLKSQGVNIEEYQRFLGEVLQAEIESNSDPAAVYPILQRRQHLLDDNFAQLLQQWTRYFSSQSNEDAVAAIVGLIGNLCIHIKQFPLGSRANNLEIAITGYQTVLELRPHQAFPEDWATTQNNLGIAYSDRIHGQKEDNLEKAIAAYKLSLEVYTREAFPYEWARSQNNLGVAYRTRIVGEKADNLEKAIAAYNLSLEVRTHEAFPVEWAATQNNLGIAYLYRIVGERADNLEKAIAALNKSLEVYTREAFPEQWAMTQNNLGNAYLYRIVGERADNLEKAIAVYSTSLEVYTPEAFPIECLGTGGNLGNTGNLMEDWETAIKGYNLAIEAVETSRSWAATPQRKQEIMEAAIDVYISIVQACINNNQLSRALEYVERSKTRNLVELLANRERYPKGNIDPSILDELDGLRQDIHAEQRRLDNEEITRNSNSQTLESNEPRISSDRSHLIQLQQQLDELIKTQISPIDPTFSLTQKVETIPYNEIQSLIVQDTAILEFYLTNDKILAFIVTSNQELTLWQSSPEDREVLFTWTNDYLTTYYQNKAQWIETLPSRLESLSNILHINDIIQLIPNSTQQLIIIPHRFLHILPLHALPIADERYNNPILQDRFPKGVNYNPSCQLLKQVKQRQRTDFNHLFAIQNPTEDLLFTDLEVTTIQRHFNPKNLLIKQEATKTAFAQQPLNNIHCSHFSCHGYFNVNNPLQSALILANAETETKPKVNNTKEYKEFPFREGKITDLTKCLTLEDIFQLDLPLCRLVTLSACETGLTDIKSLSDEYIGLPSGFLFSGSVSVVSSLWTVSDLSTALLMIKFYENLEISRLENRENVTIALKEAQQWLRYLTLQEFEQIFTNTIQPVIMTWRVGKRLIIEEFRQQISQRGTYPFSNPFYWSAFLTSGI